MAKLINGYKIRVSTLKPQLKRYFDPRKSEDIAEYRYFLKKGGWKGSCPFELEWPHLGIPQMLAEKTAEYYVTKIFNSK